MLSVMVSANFRSPGPAACPAIMRRLTIRGFITAPFTWFDAYIASVHLPKNELPLKEHRCDGSRPFSCPASCGGQPACPIQIRTPGRWIQAVDLPILGLQI